MADVREIWARLRIDGEVEKGYVRLRLSSVLPCAVYAARNIETGLEALVAEFNTKSLPTGLDMPEAQGVRLASESLSPGRDGRTRVILALTDSSHASEFGVLVNDLVDRLQRTSNEASAVKIMYRTFRRWLRFLKQHGNERLSRERKIGLLGELLTLLRLMQHMKPSDALIAWKGPEGNHHDFVLPLGALEVKSTATNDPHSFKVANIHQLEPPLGQELVLAHWHFLPSGSQGVSLQKAVELVRSCLTEIDLDRFDTLLGASGYLDARETEPPQEYLEAQALRFLAVRPGFPRIARSSICNGVDEVRFRVALAACMPFSIEEPTAWRALGVLEEGI